MSWSRLAWLIGVATVAAAGCTKANPAYCDDQVMCPGGAACNLTTNTCGEPPDGGGADGADAMLECTIDDDCPGVCEGNVCVDCVPGGCGDRTDGRNVCNAGGVCVECVMHTDCPAEAPICDNEACRTCALDSECGELPGIPGELSVCQGDGTCADEADAFIVDNSDPCTAPDGSPANPYCVIQDAVDDASGSGIHIILVRTGSYAPVQIQDETLLLIGDSTAAPHLSLGPADSPRVEVSGSSADVTIRGFFISGATTDPAAGVFCRNNATCVLDSVDVGPNAFGVHAQNADLTLRRSALHENSSGGLLTSAADFTVVNTFFWGNGGSSIGGAQLGSMGASGRREFRNNTLFSNFQGTVVGSVGAVQCQIDTDLESNIFWMNDSPMVGALCTVTNSIIDDPVIAAIVGAGNANMNPLLVSTSPVSPDLHIQAGSPAIGMSEPTGAPVDDFDGQARDADPDTGADELVP